MFLLVAFNQMFVAFPFAVILFWVGELTNLVPSIETLPYFSQIVIDIAVFMLVEEVGFYYSHRYNVCLYVRTGIKTAPAVTIKYVFVRIFTYKIHLYF